MDAAKRSKNRRLDCRLEAQEEVLLYNSDAYRSLLDLQYTRMNNGYAIPEFGLGYVRNIRVFDQASKRPRVADMMVSACYCLNMEQLYPNPRSKAEVTEPLMKALVREFHSSGRRTLWRSFVRSWQQPWQIRWATDRTRTFYWDPLGPVRLETM